jgi:hypothetical protein
LLCVLLFKTGGEGRRADQPSRHASVDLLLDPCVDYAFCDSEIEIGLKSEPKLGRNTEIFAQSQRGVGSDSAFPVHNRADATGWNSDFPGESIDTDVHWLHELLEKNLSGMEFPVSGLKFRNSDFFTSDNRDNRDEKLKTPFPLWPPAKK